jgi:methionyl-tRNA formyltransferase
MDEGLDTGPVLNQLEESIRADDDAGSLGARLAKLGGMMLVAVVRRLAEGGRLPERPQDPAGVTTAPKPGPDLRRIGWDAPAADIARLVRAMAPQPAAFTTFRDAPLKVLSAGVTHGELPAGTAPGTIVAWDDRGVLVAAGDGGVHLTELAPAGRKRMGAGAWARGARFAPGERLG